MQNELWLVDKTARPVYARCLPDFWALGGDGACEDDSGWEKHPAKKGKTLDCDWVAKSPKKRCKKKNKGGTKASKACACACA